VALAPVPRGCGGCARSTASRLAAAAVPGERVATATRKLGLPASLVPGDNCDTFSAPGRSHDHQGRPTERAARLRRKAALLASVIAIIALVVGSLFGDRGILQLMAQRQRAGPAREIEEIRAEGVRLAEIHALRTDPRAIERIAREELGLARPGETVFLVRSDAASIVR
jgi:cell division protein FtsB